MGRARDISKVFSTGTALATDTEISAFNYLTQSSASTVYQTKAAAGLTLLNTTNFTAQSTVSINDVFSATYDNYLIKFNNLTGSSTPQNLEMRLRVGGADNSSSNYYWLIAYGVFSPGSSTSIVGGNSSGLATLWPIGIANSTFAGASVELYDPFNTKKTRFHATASINDASDATIGRTGQTSVTTSYTGFTFFPSGGTLTGSMSVYGYNK